MSNVKTFECTDLGNSDRFVDMYGGRVRNLEETGQWLLWSGSRWKPTRYGQIFEMARKVVKRIYQEAADCQDMTRKKELHKWALQCEAKRKIHDMLGVAALSEPICVSIEDFDSEAHLINCKNGIVDLRSGELIKHAHQNVIKQVSASFNPRADCPKWKAFLSQVFLGDQELIGYMQRALGYAITGETSEQKFWIAYGLGSNGKGTLFETIKRFLDGYAKTTEMNLLLDGDKSQVRALEAVGRLRGARLACASETKSTKKFDEAVIKSLTGEDTLTGAILTKGSFEFEPTHKLFLQVNHLPHAKDGTHAFWRRVVIVPFRAKFEGNAIDDKLKAKLLAERDGIFAWLVEGAKAWYRDGLGELPKTCKEAIEEYRNDNDTLGRFIAECLVPEKGARTPAGKIFVAYLGWFNDDNDRPLSKNFFADGLKERGIEKKRFTNGVDYLDYRLKDSKEPVALDITMPVGTDTPARQTLPKISTPTIPAPNEGAARWSPPKSGEAILLGL
jgi:putative DNA primase/helicase